MKCSEINCSKLVLSTCKCGQGWCIPHSTIHASACKEISFSLPQVIDFTDPVVSQDDIITKINLTKKKMISLTNALTTLIIKLNKKVLERLEEPKNSYLSDLINCQKNKTITPFISSNLDCIITNIETLHNNLLPEIENRYQVVLNDLEFKAGVDRNVKFLKNPPAPRPQSGRRRTVVPSYQKDFNQEAAVRYEILPTETLTFDQNARWCYLENDGRFKYYDSSANVVIENAYKACYRDLVQENYINYSKKVTVKIAGGIYSVEFAQVGGTHRQIRKQQNNTIRMAKRYAQGEVFDKNLVRNYRWSCLELNGQYCDFEDDVIFLLENCYIEFQKGQAVKSDVLIQGRDNKTYRVDFSDMMRYDQITKYSKKVKRVVNFY